MSAPLYRPIRRLLFRLDPERAHELAIASACQAERILETSLRAGLMPPPLPPTSARLAQRLLGLDFPNPIGLAAGFDKDAIAPHLWPVLGFGFAELGTVTARPQPGNPRPRMFRLAADRGIVNRLGFNSQGAETVAAQLGGAIRVRPRIPIGVNLGCSRSEVGDLEREIADYRTSAAHLGALADYVALNVSSPNTPGLRNLQEPTRLAKLVRAMCAALAEARPASPPPLLVKIAPDLHDSAVAEVCTAAREAGAVGFIVSNTTIARPGCLSPLAHEAGGLSGAPLRARATELVALVRAVTGSDTPIIGVGGVMSLPDVLEKIDAGANLVALYTGLIYEGPWLARRLALALDRELAQRGRGLGGVLPVARPAGAGGETLASVSVK